MYPSFTFNFNMRRFFIFLILLSTLSFLGLELTIRFLGLAGHTLEQEMIDGQLRLKPSTKGKLIKGTFKEIESRYAVNKQGYNSIYDYDDPSRPGKIAIIGDSYIQGTHVNVEESIARLIEKEISIQPGSIHEYGISGWNIYNYLEVADHIKANYECIYILITNNDITALKASKPKKKQETLGRKIYSYSHLMRYLNINRGISQSIKSIGPSKKKDSKKIVFNYDILRRFPDNVFFVYEGSKFTPPKEEFHRFILIEHIKTPINWGKQEGHWNKNGRWNCAMAISNHIKKLDLTCL